MARNKQKKFNEIDQMPNVFQTDDKIKGNWQSYFKNNNPITIEIGCGYGDYTLALAKKYPNRNFIGIDIKGARIWRGALTAIEENLTNVAFLRIRCEFLDNYFMPNELDCAWIPFSDPFPAKASRRLTSPRFLECYRCIFKDTSLLHFKTDNPELFEYTIETLNTTKGIRIHSLIRDLKNNPSQDEEVLIETVYEKRHIAMGRQIFYVCFSLDTIDN